MTDVQKSKLIPQLIVIGGSQAIDFYKQAFGAEEVARTMTPDGKKLVHAELSFDGALLYVSDEFDPSEGGSCKSPHTLGGTAVRITLYVDDADKVFERAVGA
ncbi:MAG: VOC family protein, partial [Candidatus Eremiobacteraeota bacterium]|nr:VOC family protein [Candidatus Eremiobacteraeota bacterium]